ncbi:MAG TPA: DUF2281 domain-containing protein [Candidatus Deferrimicrobium sp.]|nr:DUF2281 domain-containing protein [Candidatus Deferrimicrobium sp.]
MNTNTIERISSQTSKLPESFQREVLHFVEFLMSRAKSDTESRLEDLEFYDFSLAEAMRGMDDEVIHDYMDSDFKEKEMKIGLSPSYQE